MLESAVEQVFLQYYDTSLCGSNINGSFHLNKAAPFQLHA